MKINLAHIVFSIFKNAFDKNARRLITLLAIDTAIRNGHVESTDVRKKTILYREKRLKDEQEAKSIKLSFPAFTGAGVCVGNLSRKNMKERNGIFIVDIDCDDNPQHLHGNLESAEDLKKILAKDKYSMRVWISPSYGIKTMIKIEPSTAEHKSYFEQIKKYYKDRYDIVIDPACSDISRLCFLSHDPNLFSNDESEVYRVIQPDSSVSPEKVKKNTKEITPDLIVKVNQLVKQLEGKGIDITEGYDKWLKVGFSLAHLGEHGRSLFHRVSKQNRKYNQNECDKQYSDCLAAFDPERSSFGTFVFICKEAGVVVQKEQDESIKELLLKTPFVPDNIYDNLPNPFNQITSHFEKSRRRDVLLLSSIVVGSGVIVNVHGVYDDNKVFPNLYLMPIAPPARDKSIIKWSFSLVRRIEEELKEQYQKELEMYVEKMEEWKANKKQGEKPQEPFYKMLMIPTDISSSGAIQMLQHNRNMILGSYEIDTISKLMGNTWGNWSDLMRNAFHHETYKFYRKTEKEYYDIEDPRLSIVLTGTPSQVPGFLENLENGLMSRFGFYCYDDSTEYRNPFKSRGTSLTEIFEQYSEYCFEIRKSLESGKERVFQLTTAQEDSFYKFFYELHLELKSNIGSETESLVFRLGLICFRIAMVLTVFRKSNSELVCEDVDFDTALKLTRVFVDHGLTVMNLLPSPSNIDTGGSILGGDFFNSLPDEFEMKVARELAEPYTSSRKTVYRAVKKLIEQGKIEKVKYNLFRKKM